MSIAKMAFNRGILQDWDFAGGGAGIRAGAAWMEGRDWGRRGGVGRSPGAWVDSGQRRRHRQGGGRLWRRDGDAEQGRGIQLRAGCGVKRSCGQDGNGRAFRDFPKEVGVPRAPVVVSGTPSTSRKSGSGIGVHRIVRALPKSHIGELGIVFQCDIEAQIAPSRQR